MKNPITSLIEYLRSSKAELEKVAWPTRQETLRYSLLVVGVSAGMAAFFAALDFGLNEGINLALQRQAATVTPAAPTNPQATPLLEDSVQGFDKDGNPVDIKVTPIAP
jgi:preprotein translocase subunit SecE